MKINKKLLLMALLASCELPLLAQLQLKGKVIDELTGEPLSGVNIRIDNGVAGTTTNRGGEFFIDKLSEKNHNLRFSYIGYISQHFNSNKSNENILIKMRENPGELSQIVVTGTGTHRRMANSPIPISVISQKELAKAGVSSLGDALTKLTPSVSMFTNGMGTTFSLNGINDNYLVVLENGRRIIGDDRLSRIPISSIKRIEILNGAASALYGSDAIGGVINIITNDSRNSLYVSNYNKVMNHGRWDDNIHVRAGNGKLLSTTDYEYHQAGSWQNNPIDEKGQPTGKPTSIGYSSHNIQERLSWNITSKFSVFLRGGYYTNLTDRPQDAFYFKFDKKKNSFKKENAYTYNLLHNALSYGTGFKYALRKDTYLEGEFAGENYTSKYKYFKNLGKIQKGDIVTRKENGYYDTNLKAISRLNKHHKVSIGTEFIIENFSSDPDNIRRKSNYTFALYAQDEIKIHSHWEAVAGIRYVYNKLFHSYATPNISLMYHLPHFRVRGSYATGFKTPTLQQLYATDEAKVTSRYTIGNINLKPEKSNFYSYNMEYNFSKGAISVTGFINDIRDMINYRTLSEQEVKQMNLTKESQSFNEIRQRDNVDKALVQGVNVNMSLSPLPGWTLKGGYTFTHSEAKTLQKNGKYNTTPIDKSIRHLANVMGQWEHRWKNYSCNINLQGHIQGERYSQTYGYAPRIQTWDLNTRHTFYLKSLTLQPCIGIENIFNARDNRPWNSNFSSLTPGRSFYVSLFISFQK